MAYSDPRERFNIQPGDIAREAGSSHAYEPPDCGGYGAQLSSIWQLISASRASGDLRRYITGDNFAKFELLIDREHPDEFTEKDFQAVSTLHVSFMRSARSWLRGEGLDTVRKSLRSIPKDLDIWRVEPEQYGALLGPESDTWKLWQILADLQDGARHAGKYVIAGKALHGKRPRLIPIYDRQRIGAIPGMTQRNIWEVMWCALRDSEIRERLEQLRAEVSEAAEFSLLRVADIVLWMSHEPSP